MKLSIIALSTLAISAQAWLLPNGPLPNGPGVTYANDDHIYPNHHAYEHHPRPHPPCHGAHRKSAFGAVKAWMAAHGLLTPPRHEHHHHHPHSHVSVPVRIPSDPFSVPYKLDLVDPSFHDSEVTNMTPAEIRNKIEILLRQAQGDVLPLMKTGHVRVVSFGENYQATRIYRAGNGEELGHPGGGLHGHAGWHHRRPNSYSGRLNRAMRNLRPAESLALAFVLGAGLGSILHMAFMLTLLLTRRIKCGRLTKEERQARRQARRQRRADKKAMKQGGVRLEGDDEAICVLRAPEVEEGLPRYEDEERVEGDMKA